MHTLCSFRFFLLSWSPPPHTPTPHLPGIPSPASFAWQSSYSVFMTRLKLPFPLGGFPEHPQVEFIFLLWASTRATTQVRGHHWHWSPYDDTFWICAMHSICNLHGSKSKLKKNIYVAILISYFYSVHSLVRSLVRSFIHSFGTGLGLHITVVICSYILLLCHSVPLWGVTLFLRPGLVPST